MSTSDENGAQSIGMIDEANRDDLYKIAAQKQWNQNPCGINPAELLDEESDFHTRAIFDEIARNRYGSNPWLDTALPWNEFAGKAVLEIGQGVGTDLVRMAENGAIVSAIDLTERHVKLARNNLDQHGLSCDLRQGDASKLPFADASFDLVYSIGVLHHTPDIEDCLLEAHRVLKPGGRIVIALYHRWSGYHLVSKLIVDGLYRRKLFSLGYAGLMATVEAGCDGITNKPLVRTYDKPMLRRCMRAFQGLRVTVDHLFPDHVALPYLGTLLTQRRCDALAGKFGWYIISDAWKS